MNNPCLKPLAFARRAPGSAARAFLLVGPFALGLTGGCDARAQAISTDLSSPPFTVTALRRVADTSSAWGGMQRANGSVRIPRDTLNDLIEIAYNVEEEQIVNAPAWAATARYRISIDSPQSSSGSASLDSERQDQKMLQALLATQFKLVFHCRTREVSARVLTVSPGGSKLRIAPDTSAAWQGIELDPSQLIGRGALVTRLTRLMSLATGDTVIDRTGFTGLYDFEARWQPASDKFTSHHWQYAVGTPPSLDKSPTPISASFEAALQEQLGLHLEPKDTIAVDIVFVDSVQQPPEI
jgi:uncharacterized protein (TIGR03435 family)